MSVVYVNHLRTLCLSDVSLPILHEKFEENEFLVDASLIGDYFVYKATLANHSDTCPLACIFDSKCLYYFMIDTPEANCFLGNFKKSETYRRGYDHYRYSHTNNDYDFIPSTFVRLMTKGKGLNITSSIVNGLKKFHTSPRRGPKNYGQCQEAKTHVVTDPNWTLSLSLIYVDRYRSGVPYCLFTILKLVKGKMKISIADFNVRILKPILYHCLLRLRIS